MTTEDVDLTTDDDEVARLRAENARLRAELEEATVSDHPSRPHAGRLRGVAVFVLMALAATTFAGSLVGIWARRTVFNDQVFADRAAAIGADPAVQAALATYLVDQLMTVVKPQDLFEEVLPERGKVLAPVLSNAVRGFVDERVHAFIQSENFTKLWNEVVTRGHTALVRLLRGESQVISTQGDTLVINLIPVINAALARIGEISPELFGKQIDIPTITADEIPQAAQQKISQALGTQLSPSFGIIEIQGGGDELAAAQDAVRVFDLLVYVLAIATLVLVPLAIWLSGNRRRTILQLVLAFGIATVIIRRLALGVQGDVLDRVTNPANKGAATSIANVLINPLLDFTYLLLWVLAAVAAITWVTGPYRSAVWVRGLVTGIFSSLTAMAGDASARPAAAPAIAWARQHATILQVAGVAVTVLILLVTDLSWFGTLLLAVVLGLYELAIWRLPAAPDDEGAAEPVAAPT